MYDGYKQGILNIHGLKSLIKAPTMPNPAMAIAGDDEMENIPLLIFCDQHLPMPGPMTDKEINQSYEKMARKGVADYVTIDNFVTDDFDIGPAMVNL